jgi:hypothetical protein
VRRYFIIDRIDTATHALADPPVARPASKMFVAFNDLLGQIGHLLRTHAGVEAEITKRTVEAFNVLAKAEGTAVERARHVEGAVTILPAPVAEGDQNLILRHELAVEPRGTGTTQLRHRRICYLSHRRHGGG